MLFFIAQILPCVLIGIGVPISAVALQVSSNQLQRDTLLGCLHRTIPSSSIITPDSGNFANDTIRWTTLGAPSYSVLVNAGTDEDIATSIQCATKSNITFLTTGPRHGYSITLGSVKNGLEINTAFLNHLEVDPEANTLTAGGSVTFGQAIDALYQVGKELPIATGSCSCVGLLGGSLGGGVGRLSGLHGLVLDSLLSVRLMLPNTTIITASTSENADIFWGIRGAGFNFGYVLNATYRIYDQVPNGLHLNADFKFRISQAQSYYERLEKASKSLPKELSILTLFNHDSELNETIITANAVYAGPEKEGRASVQFLLDQKPLVSNITSVPWNKLIDTVGFGFTGPAICERGNRHSQWAIGVNKIDPESYATASAIFQDMITKYPATQKSSIDVQLLPTQGILAVPDEETAYPWRNLIAHVVLEFEYTDSKFDNVVDGYARRIRDVIVKTAGTSGLNVYVSYSHGDENLEEIYGQQKLGKLAGLKKSLDPEGLFDTYHALPTAYP